MVLFIVAFAEGARIAVRHVWLPVAATFVVGVSLGLPLFLYMRHGRLDDLVRSNSAFSG